MSALYSILTINGYLTKENELGLGIDKRKICPNPFKKHMLSTSRHTKLKIFQVLKN